MVTGLGIFTAIHTLISIFALLSGAVVVAGLLRGALSSGGFWAFWTSATATSVTGFFFPFHGMTPAIGVGIIALVVLVVVFVAYRKPRRSRASASVSAAGLVISEYFLVFVAIAQAFTKIPVLHAIAPTLKEPPFGIAQLLAVVIFVILGVIAVKRLKASLSQAF